MQNFSPYFNSFPQFWVLPNGMIAPSPFFPQVPIYPQMERIQTRTIPTSAQFNKSVLVRPIEFSNVPQRQQARENYKSKKENKKIIVIPDSDSSSEVQIINNSKKIQRPPKYLTEKAYYMKQKLKGKQKTETRILRKRLKQKQSKKQQTIFHIKNMKKQVERPKRKQKIMPIMKDSEKQKNILDKIQLKLCHQYRDDFAEIPNIISGVVQLNELCRLKVGSLERRRIKSVSIY